MMLRNVCGVQKNIKFSDKINDDNGDGLLNNVFKTTDTCELFYCGTMSICKIFSSSSPFARINAEIISDVYDRKQTLSVFRKLVLPQSLVHAVSGEVIGYKMRYVKGYTLREALCSNYFSFEEKIGFFQQLAEIIECVTKLDFYFAFGDLHEENILVDDFGQIQIIDLDGVYINIFRPASGRYLHMHRKTIAAKLKYPQKEFCAVATYNTDMYCLIVMLMNWLMGDNHRFDSLSPSETKAYLKYLQKFGFSSSFEKMVMRIYGLGKNYFSKNGIPIIINDTDRLKWSSYILYDVDAEKEQFAKQNLANQSGKYGY